MCFSAYAQYSPRPVKETSPAPEVRDSVSAALTDDPNIYGLLAGAQAAQEDHDDPAHQQHPQLERTRRDGVLTHAGSASVDSVIVTMLDGRQLLITPLD